MFGRASAHYRERLPSSQMSAVHLSSHSKQQVEFALRQKVSSHFPERLSMPQRVRKGLATWLTGSSTPLFVLDQRNVVLVFNRGAEELSGWAAGDVIGKAARRELQVDPGQIQTLLNTLAAPESVLTGTSQIEAALLITRSGTECEVEIHYYPLTPAPSERILGVIVEKPAAPDQASSDLSAAPRTQSPATARLTLARHLAANQKRYGETAVITESLAMQRIADLIRIVAPQQVSVHLRGRPGVGKEFLARVIHAQSPHRDLRFHFFDCRLLTHFELGSSLRKLLEEAASASIGATAAGGNGSIYLHHVDRLPRDLQAELLRQWELASCYRWLSGSEKDLEQLDVEQFIPELTIRLSGLSIEVPELKTRREDLQLLVLKLLQDLTRERLQPVEQVPDELLTEFLAYQWPGNVAELRTVLRESLERCAGNTLFPEHLPVRFRAGRDAEAVRPAPTIEPLENYLERLEREHIRESLLRFHGNKSLAADALGIPRAKLYRRLEALGLENSRADEHQTD